MQQQQHPTVKLVVVGASGCGKTSLVRRLVEGSSGTFDDSSTMARQPTTVGLDYSVTRMRSKARGVDFRLKIWDTPADPIYAAIVQDYASQADAVMLTFDTTSCGSTLSYLESAARSIRKEQCAILVGCKCDLDCEPDLLRQQQQGSLQFADCDLGQALAQGQQQVGSLASSGGSSGRLYWRVSAKTGDGVEAAFQEIIGRVLDKRQEAASAASNKRAASRGTIPLLLKWLTRRASDMGASFRSARIKGHHGAELQDEGRK